MSHDRKKASPWPWIVALLIGLPVLYVASFGPACWLFGRGILPCELTIDAYRPLIHLSFSQAPISGWLRWYARSGDRQYDPRMTARSVSGTDGLSELRRIMRENDAVRDHIAAEKPRSGSP